MNKNTVLVSMSGGIDSSIAAVILQEQGYFVKGITFHTWDYLTASCDAKEKGCCSMDSIYEAKELCKKLDIEHHIIDLRETFKNSVITNFVDEYLAGRTPNPCVDCNSQIKWGEIIKKADELNCYYIASGHYARIRHEENGYIISKGIDQEKDQSYFLWNLSQDNLRRTLFPLGKFNKSEIRKMARDMGFIKLSEKRESQEICFIQDDDYRGFLRRQIPDIDEKIGEGDFVSSDGEYLGKHKGYPFYTIGQRKGLEIAVGYPLYVTKIDATTNTVTLGERSELDRLEMSVDNIYFHKYESIQAYNDLTVKIRYRNKGASCRVNWSEADKKLYVNFHSPVSAVTPGQSAVFYDGDDIVAGGIIS